LLLHCYFSNGGPLNATPIDSQGHSLGQAKAVQINGRGGFSVKSYCAISARRLRLSTWKTLFFQRITFISESFRRVLLVWTSDIPSASATGAWAIVHGVFEIIGAIQLRKEIQNEWMLILAGAISVIFGVIIMAAPGAGALGLVWAIAAYSIVFGAMLVGFAFRLRQHRAA
jgi:uncharacterized membrane protein HdeD (DUF308 family)